VDWGSTRSTESFDHVVGQVLDYAIIRLDPKGTIQTWSLGAERVKGYTAAEAIGCNFSMFYPEESRLAGLPEKLLAEAEADGRVEHEGWRVRKDGSMFWGDVVITALHGEDGNLTGFTKVTRDLSEEHELEVTLKESNERLRVLIGQVVDYAIIGLDTQGVIETWNLGAERLKGYTEAEAIGRNFAMFYPEDVRRAGLPMQLLDVARKTGSVEHTGWRLRKDGSRFWGDVVITALHDEEGNLTGYAKVTRDRTDLKSLEDAQDAFYAAFNHDFRTPVTALKGFVDAIRDASDDDEREHLIQRVEASADRLLGMVEGLVQFATHRAATATLLLADIDVAQVVRGAVQDLPSHIGPKRVKVSDQVAIAHVNGVAMHRVVTNLLMNALKYSAENTPVHVDFARPRPGTVRIAIRDQGRGIDPGDIDKIFDEFVRGRLAEPDGGTGLGLASVRELVDQLDGTVSIDSNVGVGTTVMVDLPSTPALRPSAPAQRSKSDTPPAGPVPSPSRRSRPDPSTTTRTGQSSG